MASENTVAQAPSLKNTHPLLSLFEILTRFLRFFIFLFSFSFLVCLFDVNDASSGHILHSSMLFYLCGKASSDFLNLANEAKSGNFNVDIVFENDIDFSDSVLADAFDGFVNYSYCVPYNGKIQGNGHTLFNLKITLKQKSGFICEVGDATIENLNIAEGCIFSGKHVGSIVVRNPENQKIIFHKQGMIWSSKNNIQKQFIPA